MPTTRSISLFILLAVLPLASACTGSTPTFTETGAPEGRIVVKVDAINNCESAGEITRVLSTENTRTQETTWSVEGKLGVGGQVPLGFLMPSLDIEAAITDHYGGKETRTWQTKFSSSYPIPANSKSILAVYYQEMTQKGVISLYNKQVAYEYPAEITQLGERKVDVACNLPPRVYLMCANLSGGTTTASLASQFESLAGTWQRTSPTKGEIVKLVIDIQNVNLFIHVYTDGSSGVADWGEQPQCIWSDPMQVTFDHLRFKETTLTLNRSAAGQLYATVVDRYVDPPVFIPPQTVEYIFTQ